MKPLSIGISPCPNDVYIFAGLILGKVAFDGPPLIFDYQDVETCNQRTGQRIYDIAKISYANFIRVQNDYELLNCGGALGRGVGPLLLKNGDADFDPKVEVLIPGEYTTANFLLDFYAQQSLKKRYLVFDEVYQELCNRPGTQGVVIHEKRFTYERDQLTLLTDLGDFWEQQTGYPIPLGAIVLKREHLSLQRAFENAVQNSLQWANSHTGDALNLCRQYAQDMNDSVMQAHIGLYVNEYSLHLGEEGHAAVSFFLEKQQQQGSGLS